MDKRHNTEVACKGTHWRWPMPDSLPKSCCVVYNPISDGNCLFLCCLRGINQMETLQNCFALRTELNQYLLSHPNECFIPGYSVTEWIIDQLNERNIPIDRRNQPVLQYTELMIDATPFACK